MPPNGWPPAASRTGFSVFSVLPGLQHGADGASQCPLCSVFCPHRGHGGATGTRRNLGCGRRRWRRALQVHCRTHKFVVRPFGVPKHCPNSETKASADGEDLRAVAWLVVAWTGMILRSTARIGTSFLIFNHWGFVGCHSVQGELPFRLAA